MTTIAPHAADTHPTAPAESLSAPATLGGVARHFWRSPTPWLLAVLLAIASSARLAVGVGAGPLDALAVLVLIAWWPLQEWLIHTQLLHFRPRRLGPLEVDLSVAAKHRRHHRDPSNLPLVFMPLQGIIVGVPVVVTAWLTLAPTVAVALTGITAYLAIALHYEWVHYLVHTRYRPRSRLYARLWRNHRLHHFRSEKHWYGVTMLAADRLLGTGGEKEDVAPSPTCRDLFGGERLDG
jgi:sterol desaturase/sphingolipid hydroxylase (fatty acid hydroxylase superfamily)